MSIPFSIGKIIDIATSKTPINDLFGLTLTQFYIALGGVICLGSLCNFGRVFLLRVVGERVAALLRARLYEKTIRQDATFYDSNRHGEIISRLSNDTTIAAKSITQNVSDGLRAIVSGIAGFGMMAYVSLPLTMLMSIIVPPLGILGVFYGRYVRKLSKRTQRALGELTKVSEERLGNIRTAQSFNGEIQEVHRYNKKIRDLFDLGRKEGLANAFFFSGSGLAGNTTVLMVLAVGGSMVSSGSITIGQLSSFLLYTIYAGSSISGLSSFYSDLMKGVGAASRIFELFDREPTIKTTSMSLWRTS
jgi:putative ABC transport system ATP-binding protein